MRPRRCEIPEQTTCLSSGIMESCGSYIMGGILLACLSSLCPESSRIFSADRQYSCFQRLELEHWITGGFLHQFLALLHSYESWRWFNNFSSEQFPVLQTSFSSGLSLFLKQIWTEKQPRMRSKFNILKGRKVLQSQVWFVRTFVSCMIENPHRHNNLTDPTPPPPSKHQTRENVLWETDDFQENPRNLQSHCRDVFKMWCWHTVITYLDSLAVFPSSSGFPFSWTC